MTCNVPSQWTNAGNPEFSGRGHGTSYVRHDLADASTKPVCGSSDRRGRGESREQVVFAIVPTSRRYQLTSNGLLPQKSFRGDSSPGREPWTRENKTFLARSVGLL
ncbi:unnamed protein product [Protopolystoma xenopodis]|uniref:Uncharacterized protein n=1 Tax=Protopolystoma xenopodis TaxID=117903 RepID=A0A448WWW9_9PLAT|nr:unnamed protein product [Protopolystoma xenopodis]